MNNRDETPHDSPAQGYGGGGRWQSTAYLFTVSSHAPPALSERFQAQNQHWTPSGLLSCLRNKPSSESLSRRQELPQLHKESSVSDSGTSSDEQTGTVSKAAVVVNSRNRTAPGMHRHRYLREMDRHMILSRIDKGEKQSALAKEYHVSRSSICYLNKHRDQVLSRKVGPFSKHPKKRQLRKHICIGGTGPKDDFVHFPVLKKQSRAVALLLTLVQDRDTPQAEFCVYADRIIQLILEEAWSSYPIEKVAVLTSDREVADGIKLEKSICAISMGVVGCPLLNVLHRLHPDAKTGYVAIDEIRENEHTPVTVHLLDTHLPRSLTDYAILLLDFVSVGPQDVCNVIKELLSRGASETLITLVSLIVSMEVVTIVTNRYPHVNFMVADIDSTQEEIRPRVPPEASKSDRILRRFEKMY